MAEYKVPQDVEAEDKFLGPLSFKQFLFFGGALITGFLIYQVIAYGLAFLVLPILPFFIVCITLAFPWTKDQPTELWLASRIRFMLVKHKRIWDQDAMKDLVTITVPKREAHIYTDGLNQLQVKSRLNALANVVDTKGWAIKNPTSTTLQTDRLTSGNMGQQNPAALLDAADPFDEKTSTIAQQFDSMIEASKVRRMENTRALMNQALASQPTTSQMPQQPIATPWFLQHDTQNDAGMSKFNEGFEDSLNEQKFLDKVHKKQEDDAKAAAGTNGRMKTVQPIGATDLQQSTMPATPPPVTAPQPSQQTNFQQPAYVSSTPPVDPAILALAQNDDLNVATIARQANREIRLEGDDEVVISLHDN